MPCPRTRLCNEATEFRPFEVMYGKDRQPRSARRRAVAIAGGAQSGLADHNIVPWELEPMTSRMKIILCNDCYEKYTSRETWKNAPLIAWCCDRCLEAIRDWVWDSALGELHSRKGLRKEGT